MRVCTCVCACACVCVLCVCYVHVCACVYMCMYLCSYEGTWRATVVESSENFIRINPNVPMNFAATVQVNPPTAYRMLKDFVHLSPGMYVCVCTLSVICKCVCVCVCVCVCKVNMFIVQEM